MEYENYKTNYDYEVEAYIFDDLDDVEELAKEGLTIQDAMLLKQNGKITKTMPAYNFEDFLIVPENGNSYYEYNRDDFTSYVEETMRESIQKPALLELSEKLPDMPEDRKIKRSVKLLEFSDENKALYLLSKILNNKSLLDIDEFRVNVNIVEENYAKTLESGLELYKEIITRIAKSYNIYDEKIIKDVLTILTTRNIDDVKSDVEEILQESKDNQEEYFDYYIEEAEEFIHGNKSKNNQVIETILGKYSEEYIGQERYSTTITSNNVMQYDNILSQNLNNVKLESLINVINKYSLCDNLFNDLYLNKKDFLADRNNIRLITILRKYVKKDNGEIYSIEEIFNTLWDLYRNNISKKMEQDSLFDNSNYLGESANDFLTGFSDNNPGMKM